MRTMIWRGLGLALTLGLILPGVASATSHEAKPAKDWDAAAVGRQLDRLSSETSKIQNGLGRHLEGEEDDSPRRVVLHDAYEIHHRVISLRMGVRNGLDRKQTEPVFRRLLGSVRNARQDAAAFPEIEEVRPAIDKSNAILKDLEGYYGLHE